MSSLRFAFEKYVATGNDFVLVDLPAESQTLDDVTIQAYQHLARQVCHRRFGVGADGILLVDHHPSWRETRGYDASVAIINANGSIAQMCGNGMRCVARFLQILQVRRYHSSPSHDFHINTLAGVQVARVADRLIEIDMAQASLGDSWTYTSYDGYTFDGRCVTLGNPHFVIIVEEEDVVPHDLARRYGRKIAEDPYFPDGTNVEFVRPLTHDTLAMAVYE
ncbi:MAG: diaminopimelate epimerase, partial [Proteobacteria bacterium]|nr:diaminopimelate epimerase [Pseudomonadota bacterium]